MTFKILLACCIARELYALIVGTKSYESMDKLKKIDDDFVKDVIDEDEKKKRKDYWFSNQGGCVLALFGLLQITTSIWTCFVPPFTLIGIIFIVYAFIIDKIKNKTRELTSKTLHIILVKMDNVVCITFWSWIFFTMCRDTTIVSDFLKLIGIKT